MDFKGCEIACGRYKRPCFDMAWYGFKYCSIERVGDGLM
jgi:hypothetical protein